LELLDEYALLKLIFMFFILGNAFGIEGIMALAVALEKNTTLSAFHINSMFLCIASGRRTCQLLLFFFFLVYL
jgi:hypothetical protein